MNFRHLVLFTSILALTSACNFTLAEDVTPPPNYASPTPLPTLVLVPPQTPNLENGKAIYAEKCAGCHGETGLGDGPQGIQLGVTVPAFGLPEIARPAILANWFTVVTRGRMDRLMPPFASLNDQQRWDVVAYAMSLHTTTDQIAHGKEIFETTCKDCSTDFFRDPNRMSTLSEVELARIVKQGNDSIPAFGANLAEDDLWAVTAYLRTLSFDTSPAVAEAQVSTPTPSAADSTMPATDAGQTPLSTKQPTIANEPTAIAQEGFGTIRGNIDNQSGQELPSDLTITLRGYEHGSDPNAGPQEVFSQEGIVDAEGNYVFNNIEMPENRIFVSEVEVDGVKLKSDYGIVEAGMSSLTLPPLKIYEMSDDTALLMIDDVRLFLDYSDTEIQIFGVYSFHNSSDKTVLVPLKEGSELSFVKNPEGTIPQGYEALQDSQPFMNTDKGLAIPPSENQYGLISFASMPKAETYQIAQPFVLPVTSLTVFLPAGVRAESAALSTEGLQTIQNFNFQVYKAQNIPAETSIEFTVSGTPQEGASAASTTSNANIVYGVGALGLALIVAGGWLYLRDRSHIENGVEEAESRFDSAEEVLDAIVALDDLYRAKKISEAAYQKRRLELKEILKGMM